MTETRAVSERERIQTLAEEYRSQGYKVTVEPGPSDLPDFLSSYRPDLAASRGGETTIIEVRSRRSLSADVQARHLARLMEGRAGWRFELVVVNDPTSPPPAGSVAFDWARARRAIDEGHSLLAGGYVAPAMLSSWAAMEAALRLLLDSEGIEPRRLAPAHLLKQAAEEGVISREDYRTLRDLMAGRNAVAHGYENASVDSEAVAKLLDFTSGMLNEASPQASV